MEVLGNRGRKVALAVLQEIPSAWYRWADEVGLLVRPNGVIQTAGPKYVKFYGSAEQIRVQEIFLLGRDCWDIQPETGGAVPPALGPRGRDWWYYHGKEMFPGYYNWFMHHTLGQMHNDVLPPWCGSRIVHDCSSDKMEPNDTHPYSHILGCWVGGNPWDHYVARTYLKCPGVWPKKLVLMYSVHSMDITPARWIDVYKIPPGSFDVTTLTWNNQPGGGTLIYAFYPPASGTYLSFIDVDDAEAVYFRWNDESNPANNTYDSIGFYAFEYPDETWRPYYVFV